MENAKIFYYGSFQDNFNSCDHTSLFILLFYNFEFPKPFSLFYLKHQINEEKFNFNLINEINTLILQVKDLI